MSILNDFETWNAQLTRGLCMPVIGKFGKNGDYQDYQGQGQFVTLPLVDTMLLLYPILAAEVLLSLRAMKKLGVTGPDRITWNNLLCWDSKGTKLADLFSAIPYC